MCKLVCLGYYTGQYIVHTDIATTVVIKMAENTLKVMNELAS